MQSPSLPPRHETLCLLTPGTSLVVEPLGAGVAIAADLLAVVDSSTPDIIVSAEAAPPTGEVVARLIAFLVPCVPISSWSAGEGPALESATPYVVEAPLPLPLPQPAALASALEAAHLDGDGSSEGPVDDQSTPTVAEDDGRPESRTTTAGGEDSMSDTHSEMTQIQNLEVRSVRRDRAGARTWSLAQPLAARRSQTTRSPAPPAHTPKRRCLSPAMLGESHVNEGAFRCAGRAGFQAGRTAVHVRDFKARF